MNERAAAFASRLQRQSMSIGIVTICLMLFFGQARRWDNILTAVSGFIVLFLVAYMLFEAALFRRIASHASEAEGCRAVDTLLAKLHLRRFPQATRMLEARMAGTSRLLLKLHLAFAVFLVLFAGVTTYRLWGHI